MASQGESRWVLASDHDTKAPTPDPLAGEIKGSPREPTRQEKILDRLEMFFCEPDFTTAIGNFTREKCPEFEFVSEDDEQPLGNYAMFREYHDMVESKLEGFLDREGISAAEVEDTIRSMKDEDKGASTCIDYLMASTTYESFVQVMQDMWMLQNGNLLGGMMGAGGEDEALGEEEGVELEKDGALEKGEEEELGEGGASGAAGGVLDDGLEEEAKCQRK